MLRRWFLDHPHNIGESYFQHQVAALGYSLALFRAAAACAVHAIIPALFERSASRIVGKLDSEMTQRAASGATALQRPIIPAALGGNHVGRFR